MNRKLIGAAVLATTVVLVLSSCSSAKPHPTSVKNPTKAAIDCGAYAELSDTARAVAANNTRIEKVADFEATSAVALDAREALNKACAVAAPGEFIADVASRVKQSYPSCADYLALGTDVQGTWTAVYYTLLATPMTPRADQRSAALVVSCKSADSTATIDTAGHAIAVYMVNHGATSGENDISPYLQGDGGTIAIQAAIGDSWTDSRGYSYTLKLQASSPNITADTANALPGKVDVSIALTMKGTLTNTTAGRNAPMPTYLVAEPVWVSAAIACTGSYKSQPIANFCSISGQPSLVTPVLQETQIAMDATVDVQVVVSNKVTYPQASQAQALGSLSSPKLWALARNEGRGLSKCLLLSGGYYVSASSDPTGCTAG